MQQTEERRRRYVKERDYFQALYEVVKVVNASLDMTTVLEEIVKSVATTMCVKASSIRLLDSRKKSLIMGAHTASEGLPQEGPGAQKEPRSEGALGPAHLTKDAQTDPDFSTAPARRPKASSPCSSCPEGGEGRHRGAQPADKVREFNQQEISSWRPYGAMALENARLHQALKTNDLLVAQVSSDDN